MTAGDARPILAFDYGLRRIGVAVGNALTATASPLTTVEARAGVPDWTAIGRLLRDYSPRVCVVGIPYNMDGSEGILAPCARAFAERLREVAQVEVALVDERLSSREAMDLLREQRASHHRRGRVRKEDIDAVAATLLLMQWLRDGRVQAGPGFSETISDPGDHQ